MGLIVPDIYLGGLTGSAPDRSSSMVDFPCLTQRAFFSPVAIRGTPSDKIDAEASLGLVLLPLWEPVRSVGRARVRSKFLASKVALTYIRPYVHTYLPTRYSLSTRSDLQHYPKNLPQGHNGTVDQKGTIPKSSYSPANHLLSSLAKTDLFSCVVLQLTLQILPKIPIEPVRVQNLRGAGPERCAPSFPIQIFVGPLLPT